MDEYEVVIVGSGFGALAAAKTLGKAGVKFSLISSTTEHLFQPLLYQAATGMISTGEIAPPIRRILAEYDSADVRLGRVVDVDPEQHVLTYTAAGSTRSIRYGRLIVATGATQAYFGHDEFKDRTFALKTVDDAIALREQILSCYEEAHLTSDIDVKRELLSFVVVGAGATGVELAGQIRDLAHRYFAASFPDITPDDVTVTLVDGVKDVLPAYGGRLSKYARAKLERSGVDVVTGAMVTDIADDTVTIKDVDTKDVRTIAAKTVIWSAGVQASALAATIAERTGCDTDRAGRLLIHDDLTVGSASDIFAIGDVTSLNSLPGQSPIAMQQGRHAAKMITGKVKAGTPFRYVDKGSMSIVGRFSAVARLFGKVDIAGPIAWVLWLAVHLMYMVGFRNRYVAVVSWLSSYIGDRRPHFQYTDKWVDQIELVEPEVERAAA
ncbi:NAD(P)/FAD-dependent oxidoreductase [Rhodococcus sp. PAMC28707]|uniref:NAD(P)/FAD-dependent oxidoreductase n=1 Tax=unclassified Rhodococcus (in: high G+C Gram-positive bacteria) TaxID=192944 RepID=UPI00109D9B34|nr:MULTISPECIES: NAD(P)/FAD-dependent oxidoreductase [unclassified Rhodococcus (in: high G+C Gram-positive bacteria)]QCB49394.1 NAD(P)/FAD-dependent oxidoreductase [Rhodococcus sp. PAMC28705]QCB58918.1 NAD(P)/FAD-dependent oxidoreductase [Rhodococcus sp. PAMC28707]